jgi:(R,R)-butanediol dehydrogenase/meso-butanediol dehydrogenase/diacetyl reductase
VKAPDDVLVQVAWCGICGTDLHEYVVGPIVTPVRPHPLTGATLPQTLGHEFSARVVEVGSDVAGVLSATGSLSCPPSCAAGATTAAAAWATCA